MSTLVVSYHDLEDAAKDARKAAALLEEYGETIEEKICKKLKEYSGSWTSNIDVSDQLMRDKLVQLRQKQEDFETLAANIETFKNNCVTADHNVKAAIESLSGDFKNTYGIKENIVTKWFNYIGTEIGNSSALGRYLKDIGNTIEVAVTDGIENIKDWYKYEGGKYIIDDIVTVALVTLEVVGAVVAIASGVGAIVAIATVIAATMTVANGLTSIYNNSKAYNAMQNENPAWAMRYAGRDTLTEQMRETSDSKFVHNLATGLDVLETSAGLILFAKEGMDALKSIKNFSGNCRILGNGGTDLIDDAAQLGAKSADGIPGKTVVDDIMEGGVDTSLNNINEFIAGNKKFDDVLNDYAEIYSDNINSNKPWSWDDFMPGGETLTKKQRSLIKQQAINNGNIPNVNVTKVDGMKFGYADFDSTGLVKNTVELPENMWKMTDAEQFKWLDAQIGGTIEGYTWHHTEIPGKMQLVPTGIHNITSHNGGRTTGMWADAPR